MLGQASFPDLEYANKKRRTRREVFLAEMDAVVPWPKFWSVPRAAEPTRKATPHNPAIQLRAAYFLRCRPRIMWSKKFFVMEITTKPGVCGSGSYDPLR